MDAAVYQLSAIDLFKAQPGIFAGHATLGIEEKTPRR
jgi:hypothetical protein